MAIIKKNPKTVEELIQAGIDGAKKQSDTPLTDQFLKSDTIGGVIAMNLALPILRDKRNSAEAAKSDSVSQADKSKNKLFYRISHNLQNINFLIVEEELPPAVRKLFGMSADAEELPDMKTEAKLLNIGGLIATGTAAMILAGFTPPLDFDAASIAVLLADYKIKRRSKNNKTSASKTADVNLKKAVVEYVVLMDEFGAECELNYHRFKQKQRREFCEGWGMKFVTKKELTLIDIAAKFAGTEAKAIGINFRIGKVSTKKNKKKLISSKLGAKGVTNAHGELQLCTTQEGDLFLMGDSPLIKTSITPIHIDAGENKSVTITLIRLQPLE